MSISLKNPLIMVGLAFVLPSCDSALEEMQPVSSFPAVVCEGGGQRQIRVYGHGFDGSVQVTFGDKAAEIVVVDPYTADVTLPDLALGTDSFSWFPYNDEGESGLFDETGEPVLWDVDVSRSKLVGEEPSPEFKTFEGKLLPYRKVRVESIVTEYEGGIPLALSGPFTMGYFSTNELRRDEAGEALPGCGDGADDYIGQFCYESLYKTAGGGDLLFDASDIAYQLFHSPWDPYLFKGEYSVSTDDTGRSLYYDDAPGFDDYVFGEVFNQSFGVFYALSSLYVYLDLGMDSEDPAAYTYSETPLVGGDADGLAFIGLDMSRTSSEYLPYIQPIAEVDLIFVQGDRTAIMSVPLNVISRDFDYSVLDFGDSAYYNFDPEQTVEVDVDRDGIMDTTVPVDGSWGCIWKGYDCDYLPESSLCPKEE